MKISKLIKFLAIAFINSIIVLILGGFLMLKPIDVVPAYALRATTDEPASTSINEVSAGKQINQK